MKKQNKLFFKFFYCKYKVELASVEMKVKLRWNLMIKKSKTHTIIAKTIALAITISIIAKVQA